MCTANMYCSAKVNFKKILYINMSDTGSYHDHLSLGQVPTVNYCKMAKTFLWKFDFENITLFPTPPPTPPTGTDKSWISLECDSLSER